MNALIAGAHGTVGHGLVTAFQAHPGMRLTTISRRDQGVDNCRYLPLDLLDESASDGAASALGECEVVVFAARAPGADLRDEAERNLALLRNIIGAVDRPCSRLPRVCLIHGTH